MAQGRDRRGSAPQRGRILADETEQLTPLWFGGLADRRQASPGSKRVSQGRELEKLRGALSRAESERDALTARLEEARAARAGLELEKRGCEDALAEAQGAWDAELAALRDRLEAESAKVKALSQEREATIRAAKAARRREEEFAALQERYEALSAVLEEREALNAERDAADAARVKAEAERAGLEAERAELAAERRAFVERCADLRRSRERLERRRAQVCEREDLLRSEREELEAGWARLADERARRARREAPEREPSGEGGELLKLSHRRLMGRFDAFEDRLSARDDDVRAQGGAVLQRLAALERRLSELPAAGRPRGSPPSSAARRREPSRSLRRPRSGARAAASSRRTLARPASEDAVKPATTKSSPAPGSGGLLSGLLRQNIALRSEA